MTRYFLFFKDSILYNCSKLFNWQIDEVVMWVVKPSFNFKNSEKNRTAKSLGKTKTQEAHGPHRSPEKTVQINYIITLIKKEEKNNNFMITYCFFI